MLQFALRWLEFCGGPREEIFVEFGISEHEFFRRLHVLLVNRVELVPAARERLLTLCKTRGRGLNSPAIQP